MSSKRCENIWFFGKSQFLSEVAAVACTYCYEVALVKKNEGGDTVGILK
jgi:hypothetical protein